MDFFEKDEYTFDDIKSLIDNQVEESIHLDYKNSGSLGGTEGKRKEITKDISSFANSDGGIIIYGLNERDHFPVDYSFIDGKEFTKERLEHIINNGINRRIQDLVIYPIRKDDDLSQTIYLVKIPRSVDAPHMALDKRFYKRFNFESVRMEEYEVRQTYNRQVKSELAINHWQFAFMKSEKDGQHTFHCEVQVVNIGDVSEKDFKVNVIFDPLHPEMNARWDGMTKNVDYTKINENRIKISSVSKMPIFPNETLSVLRFKIDMPYEFYKDILEQTKVEIYLYYSAGEDVMETDLKEMLDKMSSLENSAQQDG